MTLLPDDPAVRVLITSDAGVDVDDSRRGVATEADGRVVAFRADALQDRGLHPVREGGERHGLTDDNLQDISVGCPPDDVIREVVAAGGLVLARDVEQGISPDDEVFQGLMNDHAVGARGRLFDDQTLNLGQAPLDFGGQLGVLLLKVAIEAVPLDDQPEEWDVGGEERQHELGCQVVDTP